MALGKKKIDEQKSETKKVMKAHPLKEAAQLLADRIKDARQDMALEDKPLLLEAIEKVCELAKGLKDVEVVEEVKEEKVELEDKK